MPPTSMAGDESYERGQITVRLTAKSGAADIVSLA